MPAPSPLSDRLDPRLLLLHDTDNVLVACAAIPAGETVTLESGPVTLARPLALGHKIARYDIAAAARVLKYGAPIGIATQPIVAGEAVHVHNIRSAYTPSYVLTETE